MSEKESFSMFCFEFIYFLSTHIINNFFYDYIHETKTSINKINRKNNEQTKKKKKEDKIFHGNH